MSSKNVNDFLDGCLNKMQLERAEREYFKPNVAAAEKKKILKDVRRIKKEQNKRLKQQSGSRDMGLAKNSSSTQGLRYQERVGIFNAGNDVPAPHLGTNGECANRRLDSLDKCGLKYNHLSKRKPT